ncbi:hypothetical protein NPIL_95211 [Nephila pilipes]|uniref:Uncharacterized protein n=1 Tax=Nephila pilipes TaxID=299642 RepID=A0A8X6TSF3_NEPPI|nr:hypothetical protein NPIL_95211 [Nephila pilipes]
MAEKRRSPFLSASSSGVDQEGFDLSRGTQPLWIESRLTILRVCLGMMRFLDQFQSLQSYSDDDSVNDYIPRILSPKHIAWKREKKVNTASSRAEKKTHDNDPQSVSDFNPQYFVRVSIRVPGPVRNNSWGSLFPSQRTETTEW